MSGREVTDHFNGLLLRDPVHDGNGPELVARGLIRQPECSVSPGGARQTFFTIDAIHILTAALVLVRHRIIGTMLPSILLR